MTYLVTNYPQAVQVWGEVLKLHTFDSHLITFFGSIICVPSFGGIICVLSFGGISDQEVAA